MNINKPYFKEMCLSACNARHSVWAGAAAPLWELAALPRPHGWVFEGGEGEQWKMREGKGRRDTEREKKKRGRDGRTGIPITTGILHTNLSPTVV